MKISPGLQLYFFLFVLVVISALPLFNNLSYLPIRLFDESRLACNALEMSRDYEFLVVQYKNEPEMWSTKPPLMIWCQMICIKLFGENEFAIRFPAALSGLFTILLVFVFLEKVTKKALFAFIASLVLIATPGYVTEHGTRTGDYDSMLVLFLMMQLFSFYLYLENSGNKKYWYLSCLAVVLAVYTKGIAGLMFLPGLFLFALFTKQLAIIFRARETWIGVITTVIIIFVYYGLREMYNPGYIHKVIENEIAFRYFDVNEGHVGEWNFYLDYLQNTGYAAWYLIALAGIVCIFFTKNALLKKVGLFSALNGFVFLFVISYSQTKIYWYALPLYP
ncbi:MAG: glycosyltransferase family 39 protein, partial [Bacteroidota bacterium]|nr:glycosyltransferase family 39 protein [Bacteroidota bacterium]